MKETTSNHTFEDYDLFIKEGIYFKQIGKVTSLRE